MQMKLVTRYLYSVNVVLNLDAKLARLAHLQPLLVIVEMLMDAFSHKLATLLIINANVVQQHVPSPRNVLLKL